MTDDSAITKASAPDEQTLQKLAADLIHQENTMTLATTDGRQAWAAPVYYVFHKGRFYFFSKPQSRHIQDALGKSGVGAAIHPSAQTWQGIRGVQMSGSISGAGTTSGGIRSVGAYIKKFPFTREFFVPGQTPDLASFGERFKVKFYRFTPDTIIYMDNSIRFGFRTEVRIV